MEHRITRRDLLRVLAAGGAAAALPRPVWAGEAPARGKPFFFLQMADPQLFWGPKEQWATAIKHANRLKPAFVVVCGDLLNRSGRAEKLDPAKDALRLRAYTEVAATLHRNIPLYNVAGNHDVCNVPTPETLAWYRKHFGKPWYSFTHGDCLFVVLESDVLKNPQNAPEPAKTQMQWLRRTLEAHRDKPHPHRMVFLHHPLCLHAVDEKSAYFNLPLELRKELMELFTRHGVRAVFSGHYHRNAYVKAGDIELITSASTGKALGKDPLGFRIVKVYPDRIEHRYYGYADLPERVELSAAT